MTGFDFVFALFSLVLGLAVAEVLGGFANVMKLHAAAKAGKAIDVRVGWLTPLLAVLVTLNQLSFWMYAFNVRDSLPFSYVTLLLVLVVVGAYYLFSSLVFPDQLEDWPDLDHWYDQHNRLILGGMVAINIFLQQVVARYGKAIDPRLLEDNPAVWGAVAAVWLWFVLIAALFFVKGRRANTVLLVLLIVMNVGGAVLAAMAGLQPK